VGSLHHTDAPVFCVMSYFLILYLKFTASGKVDRMERGIDIILTVNYIVQIYSVKLGYAVAWLVEAL